MSSGESIFEGSLSFSFIGFASSWFCPHVGGVAGTRQCTPQCHEEKKDSPLFVRGRPVLKMLHDSGLAPKCNIPVLPSQLSDYVH